MEFTKLPTGALVVWRWWVRMPKIGITRGGPYGPRERQFLLGYKQDGGELVEIVEGTGRNSGRER